MRHATLVLALSLTGCTAGLFDDFDDDPPEPQAEAFCQIATDCGCEPRVTSSQGPQHGCVLDVTPELRDLREVGEAWGLQRDDACLDEVLAEIGEVGCDWAGPPAHCSRPCHLYHGDKVRGASCTEVAYGFSDCARGLDCNEFCYDPCESPQNAPVDERLALGEACSGHGQCQSQYCPAGYCLPRPRPGEACPQFICEIGAECVDGTCEVVDPPICYAAFP